MTKVKKIGWVIGTIVTLFLVAYLYSVFFKPNYGNGNILGILLVGLLLGSLISFLIFKLITNKPQPSVTDSSHTIVESMRKVFKIVFAEGYFQEIYNYEKTKKLLKIIPSTKKALVIVKAKVLIGYDFEKCKWELDDVTRKVKIISFPEPEIISLEPDFKYYYFEEDLFNFINRDDLEKIQQEGKKQVEVAALQSGLKKIAAEQMRTVLTEIVNAHQWEIVNPEIFKLEQNLDINRITDNFQPDSKKF